VGDRTSLRSPGCHRLDARWITDEIPTTDIHRDEREPPERRHDPETVTTDRVFYLIDDGS